MRDLPTGTVTFLFTDIEGSTRLLQALGRDGFVRVLGQHAEIVRTAVTEHNGVEIRTEGDAFFVAFPSAEAAVRAAVATQRGLAAHPWEDAAIRVRIGLHTGEGELGGDDYVGIDVHKAARIAASGHGGQVVLSDATRTLLTDRLPEGVAVRELGPHGLKDFDRDEPLHDLVIEGLEADFPPLTTGRGSRTNLPAPRTSFVGRGSAIAEVGAMLDGARLVTLTGPGGTGKTRLALEVAATHLDRYDEVTFVDLSSVDDVSLVVPTIAAALRLRATPGVDPRQGLHERLRQGSRLLVLDNMEQLASEASIVASLLDAAPQLTALATSRIVLHVAGEREYRVPPLALPDDLDELDVPDIAAAEAVRLFVERAQVSQGGFQVTEGNAAAVAEIVARLDGLPLALELAASRLRVLDPASLAGRLGQRFPLLTDGPRDAPERQRTLEETIRWSEEALPHDARRLFARLAVFPGGCTVEGAEAVCGGDIDVVDALGVLMDHSLLRRLEAPDGSMRFTMLETIREYAGARLSVLDSDERSSIEQRQAERVRDLAERAEPHLTGQQQLPWLETLDLELENIRAVLDRAERAPGPDDVAAGLRTAAALWRYWQRHGHFAEGRARLERLLSMPQAQTRDAPRALALGALGSIDYWLTNYDAMRASYEEAADIAQALGDRRLLTRALFNLSFTPWVSGHPEEGMRLLEHGLEVAEPDDLQMQAQLWTGIGFGHLFSGNAVGAIEPIERSISLHREVGEQLALCESLITLSGVYVVLERTDEGLAYLAEATAIACASGNPILLATALLPHALLANLMGRHHRAAPLIGASNRLERDYDVHFPDGLPFFGDPADQARAALGEEAFERR
jgi:predicted ATPase/class 3 adenylate cyclase